MKWLPRCSRAALLLLASVGLLHGCTNNPNGRSNLPAALRSDGPSSASASASTQASNYGSTPIRVEVVPLDSTAAVGTRHMLVATISDSSGVIKNQRVEWVLEGVGEITDIDDGGKLFQHGEKVTPRSAYSITGFREHKLGSHTGNADDDVTIHPGQTWCMISSAEEGDTRILVRAPREGGGEVATSVAGKHWFDAQWTFPVAAVQRPGTRTVLTTSLQRPTDAQRLGQYRVRYAVLDGPSALLLPAGATQALVTPDAQGMAPVTVASTQPQAGTNRIGVEILRLPVNPASPPLVIARGEVRCDWQYETVSLGFSGPPQAILGQDVPYVVTLANAGRVPTRYVTVSATLPDNVKYVSADPAPASIQDKQLVWTLSDLKEGQSLPIRLTLHPTAAGTVSPSVAMATGEGLKDQKTAPTQVTMAQLKVIVSGPTTGLVNVPVSYQVTVTNEGNAPATNVMLRDEFGEKFRHATGGQSVQLPMGTLAPGQSRTERLVLTPLNAEKLNNRVSVLADSGLTDVTEHALVVQKAQLAVKISGPEWRYADHPGEWNLLVTNESDAPLADVELRDQLPPELVFNTASAGGQLSGGQVVWKLGTLKGKEQKAVMVTATGARVTPRAVQVAVAGIGPDLQVKDEIPVEIRGVPAYRLEVTDTTDPVPLNGTTTYRIDVLNQGTLEGNQVRVVVTVPKELHVKAANGPAKWHQEGDQILFDPVDGLKPRQTFGYTVDVQAMQPGHVVLRAELKSATLTRAIVVEEPTRIFAPAGATQPTSDSQEPPK